MHKLIYVLCILFALISCKATKSVEQLTSENTEVAVPITNTKIEYRDRLIHDSIYNHDSIYVYIKGDTVFKHVEKIATRYVSRLDTLVKTDTIKVPVTVTKNVTKTITETKEVNKLYWWQKCFMWLGVLVLLIGTVLLTLKIKKHF